MAYEKGVRVVFIYSGINLGLGSPKEEQWYTCDRVMGG